MTYINNILDQIEIIWKGIPQHFKDFSVSTVFFIFIMVVIILNICKKIFVWWEKKKGSPHQPCEYLVKVIGGKDCDHLSHRKQFKENGNSCEDCKGKAYKMTDIEAENRVLRGKCVKGLLF